MEIRDARETDVDAIRSVARASLTASYGQTLPETVIDEAVERWYDADELGADLAREDTVFLVGVEDEQVVAFAQSYVAKQREVVGDIDWIHVSPDHRNAGFGTDLLRAVERRLRERGVDRIEGRVLAANEAGTNLYADHGFDTAGEATVEIGGEPFLERRYVKHLSDEPGEVAVEVRDGPDGRLYVSLEERERAQFGPFYAAYTDRERTSRYGWFCSHCEGFDTAMDAMGRVECNGCGNRRKPSRWDAAYL